MSSMLRWGKHWSRLWKSSLCEFFTSPASPVGGPEIPHAFDATPFSCGAKKSTELSRLGVPLLFDLGDSIAALERAVTYC